MYLQHRGSQKGTDKAKNFLFYALCVLYALSTATFILDILYTWIDLLNFSHLAVIEATLFASCDFMAQSILIYRCWIVWGCNIYVVILPSFLAFTFLVIWIAGSAAPVFIVQDQPVFPDWSSILVVTSLALSMTVNALVTGLIVFRIFKVFREVKTTADDQIVGVTGGSTLRRVMFILLESGMALFSIQLARLVVTIMITDAANDAYNLTLGIHDMLNGITPTIILVRVSMGLSFHDENSMVETSLGSLRFVPDNLAPIPETGSVNIINES